MSNIRFVGEILNGIIRLLQLENNQQILFRG